MVNMTFLVPIFLEILSFNFRPCIPNVGIPLKQITVVESKYTLMTSPSLNFPIVIGQQLNTGPISGIAIQIQQQALQLDQVPDSWPCNLESGWAAHYGRLDMPFEAMCQHLLQNQFTSDPLWG